MKSETFKGKNKRDLYRKIWEWKSAHPNAVVKETHTIENLPVDLSKPTGKFAKIDPLADFVSIRIGYEDSNQGLLSACRA
jgi:hypothetical protein